MNVYRVKKIFIFILDLLFPIKCLGCGTESPVFVCDKCLKKITLLREQTCPICEQISLRGKTCDQCKKQNTLDGLIVATHYNDPLVKKAIKTFKFLLVQSLREQLARLISNQLDQNPIPREIDFIVPVPLHKKRLKWRGFNQAELLAEKISEHLSTLNKRVPIGKNILVRTKNTKAQSKIPDYETRGMNMKKAFLCPDPNSVKQKNILLIDDVCSTCFTLNECAKTLKNAGAFTVWGCVVARGK